MITPKQVEGTLTDRYEQPRWLFGLPAGAYRTDEWRLRQLTADIVVAGTHEEKAIKSSEEIWRRYTFDQLADQSQFTIKRRHIADILDRNGVRFAGRKAEYVLNTMMAIKEYCNGKVPKTIPELTSLPGVGRHAAQVTQFLGHGITQAFGVDLHVRRIAKRMGTVKVTASDKQIEQVFLKACENPGRVSRAFVDFGKDICQYVPQCNRCPFAKGCDRVDFT